METTNQRAMPIDTLVREINSDRRYPKSRRTIFREEIAAQHRYVDPPLYHIVHVPSEDV